MDLKQAIEMSGLSQLVFDGLQIMLYDDCSRFVSGDFSVLFILNLANGYLRISCIEGT